MPTTCESTRWVHSSAFEKYHKVECTYEQDKIEDLKLVSQGSFDHLRSILLSGFTLGWVNKEFGRVVTPIILDPGDKESLSRAVQVAGGVKNFLRALEKSIYTPAIVEKVIPLNEKTIELRVKACIDSLIVKEVNQVLKKERVSLGVTGENQKITTISDLLKRDPENL